MDPHAFVCINETYEVMGSFPKNPPHPGDDYIPVANIDQNISATDAASSHDVQNPASAENTIDQPTEITTAATHIEENSSDKDA